MKRTAPILALAAILAAPLIGGAATTNDPGYVFAYVARDRDGDRAPSVGDEIRWFVRKDVDAVVVFTCWADRTKATIVFTHTTGTIAGPSVGYGTSENVTVTTAGYCESRGRTSGGQTFGFHAMPVVP